MANEKQLKPTEPQKIIEKMHNRLMNLRDSTPIINTILNDAISEEYAFQYMKTYKRQRVSEYKIAYKMYRSYLYGSAKSFIVE